jgi:hypothetical protein
MPDLTEVLTAHLALLRLRGRAERTCTERRYAVLRLAAWLACYAESTLVRSGTGRPHPGLSSDLPGVRRPVLDATAADLQAWRA